MFDNADIFVIAHILFSLKGVGNPTTNTFEKRGDRL